MSENRNINNNDSQPENTDKSKSNNTYQSLKNKNNQPKKVSLLSKIKIIFEF